MTLCSVRNQVYLINKKKKLKNLPICPLIWSQSTMLCSAEPLLLQVYLWQLKKSITFRSRKSISQCLVLFYPNFVLALLIVFYFLKLVLSVIQLSRWITYDALERNKQWKITYLSVWKNASHILCHESSITTNIPLQYIQVHCNDNKRIC